MASPGTPTSTTARSSVAQGETVTGSVTFQVPNGVTVSNVKWTALSGFGSAVEWIVHG